MTKFSLMQVAESRTCLFFVVLSGFLFLFVYLQLNVYHWECPVCHGIRSIILITNSEHQVILGDTPLSNTLSNNTVQCLCAKKFIWSSSRMFMSIKFRFQISHRLTLNWLSFEIKQKIIGIACVKETFPYID